jgi:negative regulator of sigma E activity
MSVHEEVEEHIHSARNSFEKMIAASMAVVAALLAVVSVFGQHYNTEQILQQQASSDQWAYYQAKDIRKYIAQATVDLMKAERSDKQALDRYEKDNQRYKTEGQQIQTEARRLEAERDRSGNKAHQFHSGEIYLEVAIVLLSLSILTKRKMLAYLGFFSAATGAVWAATGFFR